MTTTRRHSVGTAVTVLCLVQFLVALEFAIVNVAMPDVREALGASAAQTQWLLSAYAIALGSTLLVGGALTSWLGGQVVLRTGLALFALSSSAAVLAPNLTALTTLRSIQGVAAAIATPAALALLSQITMGETRVRALAWWGASGSLGFAGGATFGGLAVSVAGWQGVFVVCAAVAATLLVGTGLLPTVASPPVTAPRWAGIFTFAAGTASIITWLTLRVSGDSLTSAASLTTLAFLVLSAMLMARPPNDGFALPLPKSLRHTRVLQANALSAALAICGGSMVYFVVEFAGDPLGISPTGIGLALLPDAAAAALGARHAPRLLAQVGAVWAARVALLSISAGMSVLSVMPNDASSGVLLLVMGTSVGAYGLVLGAVTATVVSARHLRARDQGLGAGFITSTQQWGAALGLAALTSAATAGVRGSFATGAALALAFTFATYVVPQHSK